MVIIRYCFSDIFNVIRCDVWIETISAMDTFTMSMVIISNKISMVIMVISTKAIFAMPVSVISMCAITLVIMILVIMTMGTMLQSTCHSCNSNMFNSSVCN